MKIGKQIWVKVVVLAAMCYCLSSCSGTKHLASGDQILKRNTFNITQADVKPDKNRILLDIASLIQQKPVQKAWLNVRTWGKPPTIYDAAKTAETAESIEKFLRNKKGYYGVTVSYKEVELPKDKVEVIYDIDLGSRYYIKSITHSIADSTLAAIIHTADDASLIGDGEPLDASVFDREKARIVSLLKDEGYANFNANFIEYRGDSTDHQVDVIMHIYNPVGKEAHTRYKVGDINVYTEHAVTPNPRHSRSDTIGDNYYYTKANDYLVNPDQINDVLAIKKGDTFNKSRELKTNKNLSRLSPYRFAIMAPKLDADNPGVLDYDIFLTPQNKKWVMDAGVNLFYSQVNTQAGQTLFGVSGGVNFQNRNFAKRAITHTIGIDGTFEFNFANFPRLDSIVANTVTVQLSNRFDIPKVVDIFGVTSFLNNTGIISDESYRTLKTDGTTTADITANYTSIANYYDLVTFNGSWTYNFQPKPTLSYNIQQIGFSVLLPNVNEQFQRDILDNNPQQAKSFERYVLGGVIFRELNVARRFNKTDRGSQFLFLGTLEQSGFENFVVNRLVNLLSSHEGEWEFFGTKVSDYVRLEGDLRYYQDVLPRSSFAARLNLGFALPYNGDVVPYIRQYFVGGPNSIRGWQLREIVGGYKEPDRASNFYQTGNLKLDFSAEYRFDLFWVLEGALFLDGGNVWLLQEEESRPAAHFTSNFLDQVALATGWGLRFDFDYFLFRFDFGYKLRNPIADELTGSQIVLLNPDYNRLLGNVSFAINYPF